MQTSTGRGQTALAAVWMRRCARAALAAAVVLSTLFSATRVVAQASGLVASYSFEEASGTAATDASGRNNNGTISGAARTTSGRVGKALTFDGVNDIVNVPDSASLDLTTGMTLEAWVYPTTLGSTYRTVLLKEVPGELSYALYANEDVPRPGAWIRVGSTSVGVAAAPALPLNTWTHLAATYNGSTFNLYKNGVVIASRAQTGSIATSNRQLRIGGNTVWGEWFAGRIDEVRIYNRALSAAEIAADMNAGSAPVPPKLTITAPANNSSITGGTVNVTFASTGDLTGAAQVRLSLDGGADQVVSALSGSLQMMQVPVGAHTLNGYIARADGSKITGSDATPVAFTVVAPPPPRLTITSPANNATVAGPTVDVTFTSTGDLTEASQARFSLDGAAEQILNVVNGTFQLTPLSAGTHVLAGYLARADGSRIIGSEASSVAFNVTAPTVVPQLTFTAPSSGATLPSGPITVSFATTGDLGEADHVHIRVDSQPEQMVMSLTGSVQVDGLGAGAHLLSGYVVRADHSKIEGSDAVPLAFTIAAPPPRLTITSPANNSTVAGPTIDVTFASTGDLAEASHARFSLDGGAEQVVSALNGSFQLSQVAAGTHVLAGYLARANGSKIVGSDAVSVGFTVTAPTTAPRLTFTAPSSGATLPSGPVTVVFTTTGEPGEAHHVHIRVDSQPEQMVMSLAGSVQLDGLAAGAHTLNGYVVRADHTKIEGSDAAALTFTISSPDPNAPVVVGQWSSQIVNTPTVAVDFVLTHTNKALFWAGDFSSAPNYGEIWDPATNQISPVPNPFANIFCSAHVHLADGRILVAGGHDKQNGILGNAAASVFDPRTETWSQLPSMANRRWYPTLTLLGDGRAIVISGSSTTENVFVEFPEVYDPVTNTWTTLTGARRSVPQYPMVYLLPDGRLLQSGTTEHPTNTAVLDVATQQWSVLDTTVLEGGSGVQYAPGKLMKAGTSSNNGDTPNAASARTTYVMDTTQPSPTWRQTASMAFPRTFHNLTSLADGSVIVTSGSRVKSETNISQAVLEAELWSPETETWTTLARAQVGRIYHSTALLLADGRVAVAGSGNIGGAPDQTSIEVFSPPYLFKGPRPTIASVPATVQLGTTFTVDTPDAATIKAVNLLRPGAATHNFDQDQRFVPLTFTRGAGTLEVQVPSNGNLLPPGHYMLFLISDAGVPSVAKFVRFPAPYEDASPPTAPTNLTASGGVGSATLAWQAATDNVAVVSYEIHRSVTASFTPSDVTRVGTSATTAFTNTGVAAGVHYYAVVALDAAGNQSAASNIAPASIVADTTPPSILLSAPSSGSTVSGVVNVTATASDDVAVAGVQFRLDGASLGAEDVTAPYSIAWSTVAATNGSHVLTAVARDAAGNQTVAAAVTVTVANTASAGLVAYYAFEEGSGTSTVDGSGNGNNGTLSGGAAWAAGRSGNALSFDGVNDRVDIADASSLDLTTGMTLEAWVYPTNLSGWRTVVLKEVSGELAYTLYANDNAPYPASYVRVGGSSQSAAGASALPLNTWTHLATTYDGANLRLYVNGTQVRSRALSGSIATSNLPLRIGGNTVWGEYFAGRIDEVRIYNRALSAVEIAADMTGAPPAPRVSVTSPAQNATLNGTSLVATFASSGDLSQAHHAVFRVDGGSELHAASTSGSLTIQPVAAGPHVLDAYLVRADGTKIAGSDATQVAFTMLVPDTVSPTVVVALPRDGDTVSGTVTLSATAADNVGVAGVQFRLDGAPLGAEDTTAPYSVSWSTAGATNGTHVLQAVARDAAGNQAVSLDVNLVVFNTSVPPPAGLVAAYGFEQGSGGTAADTSGNNNAGTISGATWTTAGRFGNALQFDGVNDRVDIADANSLDLTTGMTLEAWVYPTALSGWRTVVLKEVTGELSYTLYANDDAPYPAGYVRIGGTSQPVTGSAQLPLNAWTHLATTYDGANLRLYVNGTQVGSRAVTGAIATSNLPLRIGGNAIWGEYFAGRIDEVRIYNRALSATELQAGMNTPVVGGSLTVVQPTRSSPIVVDAQARRVWVANPDSDTVTALHADTLAKQLEVAVGKHPTSVALDASNQLWVTAEGDDTVWVLDAATGALRDVLTLPWGSAPTSVVFTPNGAAGFIALAGPSRIQRIATPATRTLGATLDVPGVPRALAVNAGGTRLLVTRLRSPDTGGEVYSIDLATFAAASPIVMPVDTTATDGAVAARGLPNYLAGIAIDPADGFAWAVAKKDNILRGQLRDGQPLTFETTVRALVGRLDLRGNQEQLSRRVDLDDSSSPSAVALSESGTLAFVALQGNNRIVVLNQLGAEVMRGDTGLAPQGVAIDHVTKRVFTQDFMSRTVTVFDANRLITQNILELPRLAQVSTVATEKLTPTVLRGKQIFYNAADTRMSRDGYLSCASCHLDGEHDGRVWDFTDRGEGLRNTTSLKAGGGNALAPLHWTGNFDEVQDFENDIRAGFAGTGFMDDALFFAGTRSLPLGDAKAGASADLDALAAYVDSLNDPGSSPFRQASGALTSGAVAGQALFSALGCQACHGGPSFTDSATGLRHDVGTVKPSSGGRVGGPIDGFDTPTLLGLWSTAPYLHDGSAATLRDVLTTANPVGLHGATSTLSPAQIDQLAEFLNQIEPGLQ